MSQEYHFALELPDGSLLSIPGHSAFTPSPQVSLPAPWPPTAPAAVQNYTAVLHVRDALGTQAGPFRAPGAITVQAPACQSACDSAAPLVEYAGCLTCGGLIPVASLNEVCAGRCPLPRG